MRKARQYLVRHCVERGYDVVGVCREKSVGKLDRFKGQIDVFPGMTDDRDVIKRAVAGCDGVLVVLPPWGMHHYASTERTLRGPPEVSLPGEEAYAA